MVWRGAGRISRLERTRLQDLTRQYNPPLPGFTSTKAIGNAVCVRRAQFCGGPLGINREFPPAGRLPARFSFLLGALGFIDYNEL
jgi:hypothetical protein